MGALRSISTSRVITGLLVALCCLQVAFLGSCRVYLSKFIRGYPPVLPITKNRAAFCPEFAKGTLESGKALLVAPAEQEDRALETAQRCLRGQHSNSHREGTILLIRSLDNTTTPKLEQSATADSHRVFNVVLPARKPKDLLSFDPRELVDLDQELDQLHLGTFTTIWIQAPCEAVHNDVDKTPEFALKLQQYLLAWKLVITQRQSTKTDWFLQECPNPKQTSPLLFGSVMFRPQELVRQTKNLFHFAVPAGSTLWERYQLIYRNHGYLGLDYLERRSTPGRYAFMTLVHSAGLQYACGAVVMGYNLRRQMKNPVDLVALVTPDTSEEVRSLLRQHWTEVVEIEPVPDPPGVPTWFTLLFSKLRAWLVGFQMGYDKVALVDSDILFVNRDPSILFNAPTAFAATRVTDTSFNSGLMVFEPSYWLYEYMLRMTDKFGPYRFGDQTFLNQFFGWRMHLFDKRAMKTKQNSPGPHTNKTFAIHYFGIKPWMCASRDHDCNGDVSIHSLRSNEYLFRYWFQVHDEMERSCWFAAVRNDTNT